METREPRCISFGGLQVDACVGAEALRVVQPAALEAARLAADRGQAAQHNVLKALELDLKAARYDAERARQRYDAVDAANRLVAEELEARWNSALARVRAVEQRVELEAQQAPPRAETDQDGLRRLAENLPRVWHDPGVDARTKKRVLRCVIHEIVVDVEEPRNELLLIVHWVGGIHTELRVGKRRRGQHGSQTAQDLVDAVRLLALICDDDMIAEVLNKNGLKRTGTAHAVVKHFHEEQLRVPRYLTTGPRKGEVVWEPIDLWRVLSVPAAPDRHPARSGGHPEDPRAPGDRPLGAEPRPRPARARRATP